MLVWDTDRKRASKGLSSKSSKRDTVDDAFTLLDGFGLEPLPPTGVVVVLSHSKNELVVRDNERVESRTKAGIQEEEEEEDSLPILDDVLDVSTTLSKARDACRAKVDKKLLAL